MDEDLVGYLLDALDPEEERHIQTYLREHPEAEARLRRLRQALAPLATDTEDINPPRDLVVRTIARVAEYRCRPLPRAPEAPIIRPMAPSRSWWRRADVGVAAAILLCAALLVFPAVNTLRMRHNRLVCADNLRTIGQALRQYTDRTDAQRFPDVNRAFGNPPGDPNPHDRVAAGLFVPMLVDAGDLTPTQVVSLRCPGTAQSSGFVFHSLSELRQMTSAEFQEHASELAPFAYTLGFLDQGRVRGLTRADGILPIASDSPQLGADGELLPGNSANHGGQGQNVLFTDGHVQWSVTRILNNDDFFINQANQLEAGLHAQDYVLGPSAAQP
jgi:prepilin-type processing-associated H-X9-DG protein